jgi:hypothetical protein
VTRYRVADDVAWVSQHDLDAGDEPTAYVARLPSGPPILLEGSGCLVWLALADGGSMDELIAAVTVMSGASTDEITDDVASLVDLLVAIRIVRED